MCTGGPAATLAIHKHPAAPKKAGHKMAPPQYAAPARHVYIGPGTVWYTSVCTLRPVSRLVKQQGLADATGRPSHAQLIQQRQRTQLLMAVPTLQVLM